MSGQSAREVIADEIAAIVGHKEPTRLDRADAARILDALAAEGWSVVRLPERHESELKPGWTYGDVAYDQGWNACLGEIERLSGAPDA